MKTLCFCAFLSAIFLPAFGQTVNYTHTFNHTDVEGPRSSVEIGIWMFSEQRRSVDAIADWLDTDCGGLEPCEGAEAYRLLEPINVLWIDYDAADSQEALRNVHLFLENAGFSPGSLHSNGYSTLYVDESGQDVWARQRSGEECRIIVTCDFTYDDEVAIFDNNHGRIFGSFKTQDRNGQDVYYTAGAFSRETGADVIDLSAHNFISFDIARDALKLSTSLTNGGSWRDEGTANIGNIITEGPVRTNDHSGTAVFVKETRLNFTFPFSYSSPNGELNAEAEVGIWMFKESNLHLNAIADWAGSTCGDLVRLDTCGDRKALEPVNVLWVDFDASNEEEARTHVTNFLNSADYTVEAPVLGDVQSHTGDYLGLFVKEERPAWFEQFPSDCIQLLNDSSDCTFTDENTFLQENNHGRVFAPFLAPISTPQAFLTAGAFSRESWLHNLLSFNEARKALHLNSDLIPKEWIIAGIQNDFGNIIPANHPELYTGDHTGTLVLVRNPRVEVGFVIDDTGSMSEEIGGVRDALLRHLESYEENSGTYFQLTTFKDNVSPRNPTFDLETIQSQVASLRASGGGGCPEASVQALEAIQDNMNLENGIITLATDASPHPGLDIDATIASLRERGIRVNVVLSNDCTTDGFAKSDTQVHTSNSGQQSTLTIEPKLESFNETGISALSRIARETGGVFSFQPEVNINSFTGAQRFENTIFNIVEGGLKQSIVTTNPAIGPAGGTIAITIEGAKTNFREGITEVFLGENNQGLSIENLTVISPTQLEVLARIDPGADIGFRDIIAITDLGQARVDTAYGFGAFSVVDMPTGPTITSISPPIGTIGDTTTVTIYGVNTNFTDNAEVFIGTEIQVLEVDVRSDTELNATIGIPSTTRVGFKDVIVQSENETAREALSGPFFVQGLEAPFPRILSVDPTSIEPGEEIEIRITGEFTHFEQGETRLSFSDADIRISGIEVQDSTTVSARIFVPLTSTVGFQDVRLKTGGESAVLLDGLLVTAPPPSVLLFNFPNPFRTATTIRFSILEESDITLKVYNVIGQEIIEFFDERREAGTYSLFWNGRDAMGKQVSNGVYLYVLSGKSVESDRSFQEIKRMVFIE